MVRPYLKISLNKAGKPKRGKRTAYGQKAIQFIRKPILPVPLNSPTGTPSNGLFDNQGQPVGGEDLAFIDDEEIEEEQGPGAFMLSKGPTQVRQIRQISVQSMNSGLFYTIYILTNLRLK